uniref:Pectinesterase n=1 Tax=Setaria italica TaxID=4555 RepID=K3Y6E7_SETIT
MSAGVKLSTVCASTLYPEKCEQSLKPVVNDTSNPEDVLRAALNVALDEVAAAFERSAHIGKDAKDNLTRNAMDVCKKLLDDATEDLRDMARLKPVEVLGHNSTELSSNALAIITRLGELLPEQDKKTNATTAAGHGRRLLSRTLVGINEVASEAKGQLEAVKKAMFSGGEPDLAHRVLTTDLVGTFDEIADGRSGLKSSDLPEWMPASQRRLLQMSGLQKPNAVVAQDGSGNFKTITEAINAVPKSYDGRYAIYVKAGTYKEYVTVPKNMANVFMYGDGPTRTVVTGDKSNTGGFATIATRTFSAEGNGFICKSMGFVNTAGPEGHQAVAMHVQGDMSVFFNCRFEGYQDTLYVHANRQFFRNCEVLGTVDFIFGNSAALLQNCLLTVRKPGESQSNMVTAQGRTDPNMPTGIVLQSCRIVPEQELFPVRLQIASYLGRPWKEYARTVVMESTIGDLIKPEGWAEWMGDIGLKTLYYAEYANTGPGAGTSKRVNWPGYRGIIGQAEATQFTAGVFIDAMTWLKATGTPNVMGFTK